MDADQAFSFEFPFKKNLINGGQMVTCCYLKGAKATKICSKTKVSVFTYHKAQFSFCDSHYDHGRFEIMQSVNKHIFTDSCAVMEQKFSRYLERLLDDFETKLSETEESNQRNKFNKELFLATARKKKDRVIEDIRNISICAISNDRMFLLFFSFLIYSCEWF